MTPARLYVDRRCLAPIESAAPSLRLKIACTPKPGKAVAFTKQDTQLASGGGEKRNRLEESEQRSLSRRVVTPLGPLRTFRASQLGDETMASLRKVLRTSPLKVPSSSLKPASIVKKTPASILKHRSQPFTQPAENHHETGHEERVRLRFDLPMEEEDEEEDVATDNDTSADEPDSSTSGRRRSGLSYLSPSTVYPKERGRSLTPPPAEPTPATTAGWASSKPTSPEALVSDDDVERDSTLDEQPIEADTTDRFAESFVQPVNMEKDVREDDEIEKLPKEAEDRQPAAQVDSEAKAEDMETSERFPFSPPRTKASPENIEEREEEEKRGAGVSKEPLPDFVFSLPKAAGTRRRSTLFGGVMDVSAVSESGEETTRRRSSLMPPSIRRSGRTSILLDNSTVSQTSLFSLPQPTAGKRRGTEFGGAMDLQTTMDSTLDASTTQFTKPTRRRSTIFGGAMETSAMGDDSMLGGGLKGPVIRSRRSTMFGGSTEGAEQHKRRSTIFGGAMDESEQATLAFSPPHIHAPASTIQDRDHAHHHPPTPTPTPTNTTHFLFSPPRKQNISQHGEKTASPRDSSLHFPSQPGEETREATEDTVTHIRKFVRLSTSLCCANACNALKEK